MGTGPEDETQGLEGKVLAQKLARREKLLRQARLKVHWAEFAGTLLAGAILLLVFFRGLDSLESSQKSVVHVISPFIIGMLFISQIWIYPLRRRVNALAELSEDLNVSKNRT